jgi:hypothetical protein
MEKEYTPKGLFDISDYISAGYTIGGIDSFYSKHDENTRFVIVEKYPEKQKWIEEGGGLFTVLNVNIELIPPPQQFISLDITINKDKDGRIESGV